MPRFTPSQLFDYLFKGRYLNVYQGRVERLQFDPYRKVLNVWLTGGSLRQVTGISQDEAAQMVGATPGAGLSGAVDIDQDDLETRVLGRGKYGQYVGPHGRPMVKEASNDFEELDAGEWIVVISSNVHSFRWDRDSFLLQVRFDWGGTYDYPDIERGTAVEFLLYYSKGKFVWQRLRGLEKVRIVQSPQGQGGRNKRAMPQGPGRQDPYAKERRKKARFMRMKVRATVAAVRARRSMKEGYNREQGHKQTRSDSSGPLKSLLGKIGKTIRGFFGG